jgi:hypothetical protein
MCLIIHHEKKRNNFLGQKIWKSINPKMQKYSLLNIKLNFKLLDN